MATSLGAAAASTLLVLAACSSDGLSPSAADASTADARVAPSRDAAPEARSSDAGTSSSTDGGSVHADAGTDSGGGDASDDAGIDGGAAPDAGDPLAVCQGGSVGLDSDAAAAQLVGYGSIELDAPASIGIIALSTILVVPPEPPASGTVFLWPGLQPLPASADFLPIDNGVLQPVLTWGPTCAPNSPASPYSSWWVSAQYVNTDGSDPGFTGCQGGAGMSVNVGDSLQMTMALSGTTWSQTVTDPQTGQSVSYAIDLQGQAQARAELVIEDYGQQPTVPVQFRSTVVTFAAPPGSCQPLRRGMTDDFSAPVTSVDGTHCCIATMTLRPQGL